MWRHAKATRPVGLNSKAGTGGKAVRYPIRHTKRTPVDLLMFTFFQTPNLTTPPCTRRHSEKSNLDLSLSLKGCRLLVSFGRDIFLHPFLLTSHIPSRENRSSIHRSSHVLTLPASRFHFSHQLF
jgi:hypothetical protein